MEEIKLRLRISKTPIGYTAIDDDRYDGPGSIVGEGSTVKEAVCDLLQQFDD